MALPGGCSPQTVSVPPVMTYISIYRRHLYEIHGLVSSKFGQCDNSLMPLNDGTLTALAPPPQNVLFSAITICKTRKTLRRFLFHKILCYERYKYIVERERKLRFRCRCVQSFSFSHQSISWLVFLAKSGIIAYLIDKRRLSSFSFIKASADCGLF